jgi:translocation protein SEC62
MSLLALRVQKLDAEEGHEGHSHAKAKRIKGLWTVGIVQQQDAGDEMHYMWLYEGSQWKQKAYAIGALAVVMTLVMFPLWPLVMRQGVWYLSMGMLGLVGLFFIMAIFRLILFCITMFTHAPGLWLFPNLFEDVGFFDSFKPLWGWQETPEVSNLRNVCRVYCMLINCHRTRRPNERRKKTRKLPLHPNPTGTLTTTTTPTIIHTNIHISPKLLPQQPVRKLRKGQRSSVDSKQAWRRRRAMTERQFL